MLPTTFRFIWPSGCRGEDFQKSINQKQELSVTAMFVNEQGPNQQSLQRTFHKCSLPSVSSFGHLVSEEKIFLAIDQSETRIGCGGHICSRIGTKCAIFIEDLPQMLPTKFRLFHLAKRFQRRFFFNRLIRNKNCLEKLLNGH